MKASGARLAQFGSVPVAPCGLGQFFLAVEPCGLMKSFTEARLKGG